MLLVRRYGYRSVDVGSSWDKRKEYEIPNFVMPFEFWLPEICAIVGNDGMVIFDISRGDPLDLFRDRLAKLAGCRPDNHETYQVKVGDDTFWLKFSDWHLYFAGSECVRINHSQYVTEINVEIRVEIPARPN